MIEIKIKEIENQLKNSKSKLDSLNGKIELLNESIIKSNDKIVNLEEDKLNYAKAVEILTEIQKLTRERIQNEFETIVSYALNYIFGKDYKFQLDFGKRGNLPELNFNLIVPDCEEPLSIYDSNGGGVVDLCSLSLRLVLLEITKNNGVLILDESLKHLSTDYRENAIKFLETINKKLNRQIIFISHADEFINNAENKIEIK